MNHSVKDTEQNKIFHQKLTKYTSVKYGTIFHYATSC
jgi:hypothetical protein